MHILLAPPDLDIQLCISLYHTMLVVRLSIGLFLLGLLAVDLILLSMCFSPKVSLNCMALGVRWGLPFQMSLLLSHSSNRYQWKCQIKTPSSYFTLSSYFYFIFDYWTFFEILLSFLTLNILLQGLI